MGKKMGKKWKLDLCRGILGDSRFRRAVQGLEALKRGF